MKPKGRKPRLGIRCYKNVYFIVYPYQDYFRYETCSRIGEGILYNKLKSIYKVIDTHLIKSDKYTNDRTRRYMQEHFPNEWIQFKAIKKEEI